MNKQWNPKIYEKQKKKKEKLHCWKKIGVILIWINVLITLDNDLLSVLYDWSSLVKNKVFGLIVQNYIKQTIKISSCHHQNWLAPNASWDLVCRLILSSFRLIKHFNSILLDELLKWYMTFIIYSKRNIRFYDWLDYADFMIYEM